MTNLYWIAWNQHGDAEHAPDYRPVAWPPPPEVLAFWCTGTAGDGSYNTVVALVRAESTEAAAAVIQAAWSPGVGEWRFNEAYKEAGPPGDRFPVPDWSKGSGRWPWSMP